MSKFLSIYYDSITIMYRYNVQIKQSEVIIQFDSHFSPCFYGYQAHCTAFTVCTRAYAVKTF